MHYDIDYSNWYTYKQYLYHALATTSMGSSHSVLVIVTEAVDL